MPFKNEKAAVAYKCEKVLLLPTYLQQQLKPSPCKPWAVKESQVPSE